MNRAVALLITILLSSFTFAGPTPAEAAPCSAADFGTVVDETAQALRDLNASGAQRFQAKLRAFQQKYDLSDAEIQARAASIQDNKMSDFNREIESLVSQMDTLSQTPSNEINCERLNELKRVRDRLLTVMGQKSGYLLAKADEELDKPAGAAPSAQAKAGPGKPAVVTPARQAKADTEKTDAATDRPGKEDKLATKPSKEASYLPPKEKAQSAKQDTPKATPPAAKLAEAPAPALNPDLPERRRTNPARIAQNWQTDSQIITPGPGEDGEQRLAARTEGAGEPPTSLAPPAEGEQLAPPPGSDTLAPPAEPLDTAYTIEEISDAGRGLFGTVTAQFAAAINYAFQRFGRPNAYITGSEGGAAFLAGLRYGKGKLHSKTSPVRAIYWQGPSLGYDLGAEGSNALFLVYNLEDEENIYGRFTGIGGAAYVAGGVGLNVLGKGGMVMVPIRTGVGLRLGANLAYLKFTERQTWNPF